jgi:hypothetical protein
VYSQSRNQVAFESTGSISLPSTAQPMDIASSSIAPSRFLRRIELDLKPEVLASLERLCERTGRSIDELVVECLDRSLNKVP